MRKKIKVTEKIEEKILQKNESRESLDSFITKFITNFGTAYKMHKIILNHHEVDTYISYAIGQNIVSNISSLETLLRDIFIYIATHRQDYSSWLQDEVGLKINGETSIEDSLLFAEMFNFQNLSDIEKAFELLFNKDEVLDSIGDMVIERFDREDEVVKLFSLNRCFTDWKNILEKTIDERHKIVHDANYRTNIEVNVYNRHVNCILYFGQMFALYIISEFKMSFVSLHIKKIDRSVPMFATLDDFDTKWVKV